MRRPLQAGTGPLQIPNRYPEADTALARTQAVEWLQGLEARLTQRLFLFGDHATLVDMAIAPFVRQFAGIDATWWDTQPWPHLQTWLARWQASRLFESVMHKLPAWTDGTEGVPFPRCVETADGPHQEGPA